MFQSVLCCFCNRKQEEEKCCANLLQFLFSVAFPPFRCYFSPSLPMAVIENRYALFTNKRAREGGLRQHSELPRPHQFLPWHRPATLTSNGETLAPSIWICPFLRRPRLPWPRTPSCPPRRRPSSPYLLSFPVKPGISFILLGTTHYLFLLESLF